MSSLAAEAGTANVALYSATKAFDLVLAEGLWYELRDRGVDVVAIRPGSTRTAGWQSTQPPSGEIEGVMEPADVVRDALAALGTTPSIAAGAANRAAEAMFRSMARRDVIELMSGITSRSSHRRDLAGSATSTPRPRGSPASARQHGPTHVQRTEEHVMRIVVLGAGFGGLELSTRLSDELGDAADVVLIDKGEGFVFGFSKLDVMFGRTVAEAVRPPLRGPGEAGRPVRAVRRSARSIRSDEPWRPTTGASKPT